MKPFYVIDVLDGILHGIYLSHMNEEEREEAKVRYICISQTASGSVKAEKINRKRFILKIWEDQ